jgi:hypothetical protein
MSWEDQGRQERGWFGHGTTPATSKPSDASPDRVFDHGNYEPRIDAIAHTALMHMPRKERHRDVLSFDRQRLERLRKAMAAWISARSLSDSAFRQNLVSPSTSATAVKKLRAAAEGVRTATTHEDLAQVSANLASGVQSVGIDRWPGFLRDAAKRADSYQPARSPVVLAQAATSNTATDASPGAAPGRYVADNPEKWAGRPSVGTGECVPLVQQATGAPRSTQWRPGVQVQGNTAIRPGTAIATFDSHYSGHAAIYLGQDAAGIRVVDQWNNRDNNGHVISRQNPHERTIFSGRPRAGAVDQAERYYVVE